MTKIKTFHQYVTDARKDSARRHGISLAEATRELPDFRYGAEWRDYVVRTFNQGADMPTALWRSLDEGLRYRVLRSPRALRDDALTRDLRDRAPATGISA